MQVDSQIVFLSSLDLQLTTEFYESKLGLELALDQKKCRIFKVAQAAYIGFCEKPKMPSTQGVIVTIVTQKVDEFYQKLCSLGVVIEKPPRYNPEYEIYHFFLRDPNGYLVEVQRFEDPRWTKIETQV